ncbi:MAG: lysine biosynthesis protein LysW [Chloroflexi bacterium]|nr:lysine biosynthesis protein LysW [Ardenticatenaceae bacterium]MBL1131243.1 lysine biosynthesis protein LysW [Chloroflexota bacterium]NOG37343.1 lysine biosynthesis protein LysW [Chloroflexota bacterium]
MAENSTAQVRIGICPGCGARIRFQQFELGEFVVCEECGDELEVVQTNPIKLDWAYSEPYENDDWDDDDDFDDGWDDYDDDDDWED